MMVNENEIMGFRGLCLRLAEEIRKAYWQPLHDYVVDGPNVHNTFTGLLLSPEKWIFYFGKTHLAIEYIGALKVDDISQEGQIKLEYHDFTNSENDFVDQIIGFSFEGSVNIGDFLPQITENLMIPTDSGFDKLMELGWNFGAQSFLAAFNPGKINLTKGKFSRLINSFFFDANKSGLITRHIKWIDFIPINFIEQDSELSSFSMDLRVFSKLIEHDAHYIYPLPNEDDFKYSKLPRINRFIELIGNKCNSEPEITRFLSEEQNKFILSMAFLAQKVYSQLTCEWQSDNRKSIKPDFFVLNPDGFADILEFKLPNPKNNTVTGKENRETFSAELNSYISQTRVYKNYFDDPNNRKWFENKYGFKVHHPKRILVVGRRWDFETSEWRDIISDYKDIVIKTYDDLIDGVTAQLYL